MPAALKLQDLWPPGERARRTKGEERGIRAGRDVANLLGAGHRLDHFLSQPNGRFVEEVERRPLANLMLDGLKNARMAVANQHRAGAHQVVDVLAAVDANQVTAAALADYNVLLAREHEESESPATHDGAGRARAIRHSRRTSGPG